MKYIVKEIKDEVTREQAIAKAKEIFKAMKLETDKQLPEAMIYGITVKGKPIYFSQPIVCQTYKEIRYESDRLIKENPGSTILILYRSNFTNDSKRKKHYVELEYKDLPITLWTLVSRAHFYPANYDDSEININWTYYAYEEEVFDFFYDNAENFEELKDIPEDQIEDYISEHFDDLIEKYYKDLLEEFKEKAREDAEENYEPSEQDYDNYYDDRDEW